MVFHKNGMTLIELIVVLVIVGIAAAMTLPNYLNPSEQARAASVQNNLLAIYSAQQNYNNNNGSYCYSTSAPPCDTLAHINTNLGLSMQDDGTYLYTCNQAAVTCTATRNNGSAIPVITVALNAAIQLTGEVNPSCTAGNIWCP